MSQHYTVIANNRTGTIQLSKNIARLDLPDVEAEISFKDAHPVFFITPITSEKNAHLSKYAWKAAGIVANGGVRFATAEEAEAGTIRQSDEAHYLIPKTTIPRAFVQGSDPENPYTVYRIFWFESAVGGPRPDHKHTHGCTCPQYRKGNGTRPTIRNGSQPICKHILAVGYQYQIDDHAEKCEARKAEAIHAHQAMINRYRSPLDPQGKRERQTLAEMRAEVTVLPDNYNMRDEDRPVLFPSGKMNINGRIVDMTPAQTHI